MVVELDMRSQSPIYEQLRDQIIANIASKQLIPGESLPSARKLSAELGVNFHTVSKAYQTLCDEGYIIQDRRKGALVTQGAPGNESFTARINARICQIAAEAICHGIDDTKFLALCIQAYRGAKGE